MELNPLEVQYVSVFIHVILFMFPLIHVIFFMFPRHIKVVSLNSGESFPPESKAPEQLSVTGKPKL